MRIEVHVKSLDDLPTARDRAKEYETQGDDVTVIVAQPRPANPAAVQPRKAPI